MLLNIVKLFYTVDTRLVLEKYQITSENKI